jgi:hypothetical protein
MKVPRAFAVVVILAAVACPASAAAKERCAVPRGATVVARSPTAVVWKLEQEEELEWRGCSIRSGRSILLTESDQTYFFNSIARVRLAGRYAAYVETDGDHYGSATLQVVVKDLVGRSAALSVELGGTDMNGPPMGLQVTGLAVTREGGIAWRTAAAQDALLESPDKADRGPHDSVGILDERGAAIVSEAPFGTIGAFRLRRDRLTWTVSGAARSATLEGRARSCRYGACWLADPPLAQQLRQ